LTAALIPRLIVLGQQPFATAAEGLVAVQASPAATQILRDARVRFDTVVQSRLAANGAADISRIVYYRFPRQVGEGDKLACRGGGGLAKVC
jgi:hypothetical protein